MATATTKDHADAARIATAAGNVLLELRSRLTSEGAEPGFMKDAGDRGANEVILRSLLEAHPTDAVLSEESADTKDRLTAARTWIVDPLDGTREYSEVPRDDWAVHVALVIEEQPVVGAVALPARGRTLSTDMELALPERGDGPVRIAVSRTRPPALAEFLAERMGGELVPMGSAGVKVTAVVTGEADMYVHGGGQYEWDSAAPVAVARAAGAHTSRLDGSPLRYNQSNPYLPDLIVCRPEYASEALEHIAAFED